ncbi:MAG: hypothetical protein ACXVR0_14970 [Solirubrobacteraceae bacterium]
MDGGSSTPPAPNPVLRYMAILRAARDFGVPQPDITEIAQCFDPRTARPRALADALADRLPAGSRALHAG